MKIQIEETPFEYFPFWVVPQGGERDENGQRAIKQVSLEIWKGVADLKGLDLDALIFTSDLQGTVIEGSDEFLLGEKLPNFLKLLIEVEFPHLKAHKIGVCLSGDLYATLEKRGGLGDVKNVWRAFNNAFKWVVGVAGNHDDFGNKSIFEAFKREEGIYYLNHDIQKVDSLEVGGISGIIGNNNKVNRLAESDFLKYLKQILLKQPKLLLLHQGPDFSKKALMGDSKIREIIEQSPVNLIVCGHCHWHISLVTFDNGTQILNVDSRVVILTNSKVQSS